MTVEVSPASGGSVVTLTDGATIDFPVNRGTVFTVTLAGNRAMANPTGLVAGKTVVLMVNQDGTGNRTLDWGNLYRFENGAPPVLTTYASDTDVFTFISDGTYLYMSAKAASVNQPLLAPEDLVASDDLILSVGLSWLNRSSSAQSILVQKFVGGVWTTLTQVNANVSDYTDNDVNGTFNYRVVAKRGIELAPSNENTGTGVEP